MSYPTELVRALEEGCYFDLTVKHQASVVWSERWWLTPHDKTSKGEK